MGMLTEGQRENRSECSPWPEWQPAMKTDSSVMVVYEDAPSRQKAVQFCDRLVERFWSRYGFDISWWAFATLLQADASGEPTRRAGAADAITFATRVREGIPAAVRAWHVD